MANKKLDYQKIYELVIKCRKSGLSDKQWCIENDIAPSTFYSWIRKLQEKACYEVPGHSKNFETMPAVSPKQDVVCVNIIPETEPAQSHKTGQTDLTESRENTENKAFSAYLK